MPYGKELVVVALLVSNGLPTAEFRFNYTVS